MIDRDRLRSIYADQFGALTLADDMVARIKRAMLEAALAQQQADAALALAQSGRRKPVLVCGSCAQFVADTIKADK